VLSTTRIDRSDNNSIGQADAYWLQHDFENHFRMDGIKCMWAAGKNHLHA